MTHQQRSTGEPFHYSDGGVSLDIPSTDSWHRLVCDQCGIASVWRGEAPRFREGFSYEVRSLHEPFDEFYEDHGKHFCLRCLANRSPRKGSCWWTPWSRNEPRRQVVRVYQAEDEVIRFELVFDLMWIGASVMAPVPSALPRDKFYHSFTPPVPADDERGWGSPWLQWNGGARWSEPFIIQHWGAGFVEVEREGEEERWDEREFVQEFVPIGVGKRRTWLDRVLGKETV